jgi:hypothetical protein
MEASPMVTEQHGSSDPTQTLDPKQIEAWLDKAQPQDVLNMGKKVLDRISNYDQNYQRQFAQSLDRSTVRIFENA